MTRVSTNLGRRRTSRRWIAPMGFIGTLGVLACLASACGSPAKPTDTPPLLIPSITAIEPSVAQAVRTDLVLGITGTNFVHDVTRSTWAIWTANGADTVLSTTVLNSSTLTAIVPAALLSNPGEAQVQVVTGDPKFVLAGPEYPRSNSVKFEITPGVFPANVLGTYLATFTASLSCASALPESARERTYSATLLASGDIRWTGPTLHPPSGHGTISSGQLSSSSFSFSVDVPHDPQSDQFNGIWDEIGGGTVLTIAGKGIGEPHGSEIIGTFNGLLAFYGPSQPDGIKPQYCNATDHRFRFVTQ
jgi:hypothetical protein